MIPYVRKQMILDYLKTHEVALQKEIADYCSSSVSTIRRDLLALTKEGQVVMLNGGAVKALAPQDFDQPVERKRLEHIEAKEIIAQKASALVANGDVIYIDSGTTPIMMLKYLKARNLTIVTSSVVFPREQTSPDWKVIFLGGELLANLESVVGTLTEKQLLSMYFDKAFVGANGYTKDGVFTYDIREARKKEIVKEQSKVTYLLADTSKDNKRCFARAFSLNECILITERDETEADGEDN